MGRCRWLDWTRGVHTGNKEVGQWTEPIECHLGHAKCFKTCSMESHHWHIGYCRLSQIFISYFRTLPAKHLDKIAEQIRIHNINALLVIGGFEVCRAHNSIKYILYVIYLQYYYRIIPLFCSTKLYIVLL